MHISRGVTEMSSDACREGAGASPGQQECAWSALLNGNTRMVAAGARISRTFAGRRAAVGLNSVPQRDGSRLTAATAQTICAVCLIEIDCLAFTL